MTKHVKPDWHVCSTTSYFEDDIKSKCTKCKQTIYNRPYGPKDVPKICATCTLKIVSEEDEE